MDKKVPDYDAVRAASARLGNTLHRTPVLTCCSLDEKAGPGVQLFFKAEHLQKTGSFKARGASNAMALLCDSDKRSGVVTHSSGNHAAALAWAAQSHGVAATVVMPENSLANKIAAVRGYGAKVILCEGTLAARESTLASIIAEDDAVFIPPYDDPAIIAGQGTAALELVEQVGDLDAIIAPVGGGGLLAGTALVAAHAGVKVFGAEPALADDAFRSFQTGERQPAVDPPVTVADGLRTGIGRLNWATIQNGVERILLAEEEQILDATRDLMQFAKWVVEPSGAVPLAALLAHRELVEGKRIGVILSGGNVDAAAFFR
jgi:threonine dehydratase